MNQLKALVTGLIQNPGLVKTLVENPQVVERLAGFGRTELSALSGLGAAVSGLLANGSAGALPEHGPGPGLAVGPPTSQVNGTPPGAGQEVAIVSILALAGVVGAVAVLGTVAVTALNRQRNGRTS